jgi:adenylate kinase
MDIVLLGPPGAGKGTQGEILSDKLGIPKLATGDVLREAIRQGTKRGLEAKAFMERGDLVPDEVILAIMREAITKPEATRGVILDGVVRTVPQAEGLEQVLEDIGRTVDIVLMFDVSEDELVKRLSGRTICSKCQTPYTGKAADSACPKCGGTLMRRKDDEPDAVRNRLSVYKRQTEPVLAWYRESGTRVEKIDATGTVDEVTKRAMKAVGE